MRSTKWCGYAVFLLGVSIGCGSSNTVAPPDALPCLAGSMQCGSTCVDLMEDQLNCGACGTACGVNDRCTAGSCTAVAMPCPAGTTTCSGTCKDLAVDPQNCGACGTVCGPAASCDTSVCSVSVWEPLASLSSNPAFSDFTPAGQSMLFTVSGVAMGSFTFPTTATPTGVFANLSAPPMSLDSYNSLAWVGTQLHTINNASVLTYDIATNVWTTPVNATLTASTSSAESVADDAGYVYATATNRSIIQFKVADATVAYFPGPADLGTSEPRAAWDTTTKRLYLADYGDASGIFYAFNPLDGTFTSLAPYPDPSGVSDAFCSDHSGHIFTANSDCSVTSAVWMYTAATNAWSQLPALPFAHGCNAACTVTKDGWLYFGEGDNNNLARLKL